jgi:hypothetical protein
LQTICPDWLQTSFLLISASWVARITSMNHWLLDFSLFFKNVTLIKYDRLSFNIYKYILKYIYMLPFFWLDGLNSGLHDCKQELYNLSHASSTRYVF